MDAFVQCVSPMDDFCLGDVSEIVVPRFCRGGAGKLSTGLAEDVVA